MKLTIDPEADALYLSLNDAHDNIVGVELLQLSSRGRPVDLDKLVFETLRANRPEEMVVRETPSPSGEENS